MKPRRRDESRRVWGKHPASLCLRQLPASLLGRLLPLPQHREKQRLPPQLLPLLPKPGSTDEPATQQHARGRAPGTASPRAGQGVVPLGHWVKGGGAAARLGSARGEDGTDARGAVLRCGVPVLLAGVWGEKRGGEEGRPAGCCRRFPRSPVLSAGLPAGSRPGTAGVRSRLKGNACRACPAPGSGLTEPVYLAGDPWFGWVWLVLVCFTHAVFRFYYHLQEIPQLLPGVLKSRGRLTSTSQPPCSMACADLGINAEHFTIVKVLINKCLLMSLISCLYCPYLDLCSQNPDVVFSVFLRWDFSGSIQKKDFRTLLIIKDLSAAFISCLSLFSICMEIYRPLRLLIWHCLSMLQVLCRYQHIWNIDLRFRPAFLGGIMQATGS